MKHFTTTSQDHYRAVWRSESVRFIAALAVLSNCIVWAVVAAFYGAAWLVIALAVAAVFFTFVAAVKMRDCTHAHDRMLRSIIHPEDLLDDTYPDEK